jgi:integrase
MTAHNSFADTQLITLETLREQVLENYDLSFPRRREIASAIKTLSKWSSLPLATMPASATYLGGRFKELHPDLLGVSKRRIQNVRSLILAGLRAQGLNTKLSRYMEPMSTEWVKLWGLIDGETYFKTELSRFFHYCSKQKIAPSNVTDAVSQDYLGALEDETLIKNPKVRHQSVCRVWNKCSQSYKDAGWPQAMLTVPKYDERLYGINESLVPESIQKDLEQYLTYLSGGDPFSAHPKPFKPTSLTAIKGHFWRYLSALHHQGVDLQKYACLSDFVTPEMFKRGMRWFWERNGCKTSKHLGEIAWTIRNYAVKHLEADEETIAFYAKSLKSLRVPQLGLSDKNQAAMAQFDDPRIVEKFVSLPPLLWSKAESIRKAASTNRIAKKAHLLIQSAVAIEILTFAPMRLSNLQGLRLDEHLNWMGQRARISIPRQQVKNNQALEYLLPESLSKRIKDYLSNHREYLGDSDSPYLFPGRSGHPKDCSALRNQIRNTLWNEAAIKLTPHQFRHAAAKILLDTKPGYYEVVRKVLGHKSLTTTYNHYAGAETQAAINLYDDVIIQHKRKPLTNSSRGSCTEPPFMDPLQFFGGKK